MINELCIIHKRNKIEYVFCTTVRLFNTRINLLTSCNIFHIVYHFNLDISQYLYIYQQRMAIHQILKDNIFPIYIVSLFARRITHVYV